MRLLRHLSYANVMATVAVFLALGGVSYAAVALQRNSVLSKHIRNGQVRTADLARGAVDGAARWPGHPHGAMRGVAAATGVCARRALRECWCGAPRRETTSTSHANGFRPPV